MADLAVTDLKERVEVALARGGPLFTAGERAVLRTIMALQGEAASLFARLCARKPTVFHLPTLTVPQVTDIPTAAEALCAAALADGLVPCLARAQRMTATVLREACRARGLTPTGNKAALVARVATLPCSLPGPWLRLSHRALLERVARLWALRPFPDPSAPVVARLGHVRWHTYALTPGPGVFRDRRALLAWESLLSDALPVEAALVALGSGTGHAPGRLDLTRSLAKAVSGAANDALRDRPAQAAGWFEALARGGHARLGSLAVSWARALEKTARLPEAMAVLREARSDAFPSEQVAISRAGRRLARTTGQGIPPPLPLLRPAVRSIRLNPAGQADRPLWESPGGPVHIEAAAAALVTSVHRRAVFGEGAPFATLAALLCADLLFWPVPGALPVHYLAGPLDLGTPRFAAARADPLRELMARIDAGEGPQLVLSTDERWRGLRLAGAHWDQADKDLLIALASGLGPVCLRTILTAYVGAGPRAMAGLPDLTVLPGPRTELPGAFPARLPEHLVLAEIKGPTDAVRDGQAVWHDRLLRAGAIVERWDVGPPPGSGQTAHPLR